MTDQDDHEGWVTVGVLWDPQGLASLRQAAAILGVTIEDYIKATVEQAALVTIKTRGGMLDLTKTSERLGVTRSEVVDMIGKGSLRARKIDGDWFVDGGSIDEVTAGRPDNQAAQIELDLRELVQANGLAGLELDGDAPSSLSLSWCYVSQSGVLICPRAVWPKVSREKIMATARDAVRRYVQRPDQ